MRWRDLGEVHCSIARALSVVGDRWTLMVLRDCFLGARRFDDLEASLGVSPHVLSTRLRKLEDAGVLERRPYQERPVRHEYRLTEKGRDLYPVIAGLLRFGDRWMAGDDGPPVTFVHDDCGHTTTPTLVCSECRDELDPRALRATFKLPAPTRETRAESRKENR